MKNEITVGDKVTVGFYGGGCIIDAIVLYVPQATGDSWHLRRKNNTLVYVQQFETMALNE